MKKHIILILLSFQFLTSQDFHFERLITDYYGIASNGKNILCYGDYGIITYSSNRGDIWNQLSIGDEYNIRKIKNIKKDYYGFCKNSLIKSTDNGFNWQIQDIDSIDIIDFDVNEKNIFVLTEKYILMFDINLNYISTIMDLDVFSNYTSICIDDLNLYIAFDNENIMIYNIESKAKEIVNILKNLDNDIYIRLTNLKEMKIINNEIYVNAFYNSGIGNYANFIIKSSDKGHKWYNLSSKLNNNCYEIFQNKLHTISLFNLQDKNFLVTYERLDSTNQNKSYYTKVSKDRLGKFHRITSEDICTGILRVSKDTIIAVGNNKLITRSTNNGINWTIVSFVNIVNNIVTYAENDNVDIKKNTIRIVKNHEIISSNDNGTTFNPLNYSNNENNKLENSTFYFDSSGNGVIKLRAMNSLDTNVLYFDNKKNSCKNYYYDPLISNSENEIFNTKSLKCNNYHYNIFIKSKIKNGIVSPVSSLFLKYNNYDFKFTDSLNLNFKLIHAFFEYKNNIYILGSEFSGTNKADSLGNTDFKYNYILLKSSNDGKSWDYTNIPLMQDLKKDMNGYYFSDPIYGTKVSFFDDYIYIPQNNGKILRVDVKNNNIDSIFTKINFSESSKLFQFQNKIFTFVANKYLYFTDKLEKNSKWDSIEIKSVLKSWDAYANNGLTNKDAILNLYEMNDTTIFVLTGKTQSSGFSNTVDYKINFAKFNYKDISSSINIEEEFNYFYSYPAYPTPSFYNVNSLIYWDNSYNIDIAEIGVYDIYENKIADRGSITLKKLAPNSAILTWNCQDRENGVYFIQIKHGNNTKSTIKVLVAR
jgi:hypothetical protein